MMMRTESEIKAYVDGYNACYKDFRECLKSRKSLADALQKMNVLLGAVNAVVDYECGEERKETEDE